MGSGPGIDLALVSSPVQFGVARVTVSQVNVTVTQGQGSFRVRSTNGLRVTPPISMKFGTLADNA